MFDIETKFGTRQLAVIPGDITNMSEKFDLLVISAYHKGYDPVPNTVIGALDKKGISIKNLEKKPLIDLRPNYNAWLSEKQEGQNFSYILCLEMEREELDNERLMAVISNIFTILAVLQVKQDTIIQSLSMPILGSGFQKRNASDMVKVILETFKEYLNKYSYLQKIIICEIDKNKASEFQNELEKYFQISKNEIERNRNDEFFQKYRHITLEKIQILKTISRGRKELTAIQDYMNQNKIEFKNLSLLIRKFLESIDPNYESQSTRKTEDPIKSFSDKYGLKNLMQNYLFLLRSYGNEGAHTGMKENNKLHFDFDQSDSYVIILALIKVLHMWAEINKTNITDDKKE